MWLALLFYFNFATYASLEFITHDAIYWILSALGPKMGLGLPYQDFWDDKPPGVLMLIRLWSVFFGESNFSFKLYHAVTLFSGFLFFLFVLRKSVSQRILSFVSILAGVFYFSPQLNNNLMSIEQQGTLVSLAGLLFLIRFVDEPKSRYLFCASFFLFFSGFVKDPFFLGVPSLLPVFVRLFFRKDRQLFARSVFWAAMAFALVGILIAGYLGYHHLFPAFLEVQQFKSYKFSPWERLSHPFLIFRFGILAFDRMFLFKTWPFLIVLLAAFLGLSGAFFRYVLLKTGRRKASETGFCWIKFWTVLLYFSGMLFGLYFQGKTHSGHYLHLIVLPFFLFLSQLVSLLFHVAEAWCERTAKTGITMLIAAGFLAVSFPGRDVFSAFAFGWKPPGSVIREWVKKPDVPNKYSYLREHTNSDDRILSIYGWSAGTTYFYSRRKPISRHIMIHPSMFTPELLNEYIRNFVQRIPRVIEYRRDSADMDVAHFENLTLQIKNILDDFYIRDTAYPDLHFLKTSPDRVRKAMLNDRPERYLSKSLSERIAASQHR